MQVSGEDAQGRVRVIPDPDNTESIKVQRIIKAVGAEVAEPWIAPPLNHPDQVELSHCLLINPARGPVRVYGGDLTADLKSVVNAVASGKQAAMALDTLFREGAAAVRPLLDSCLVGNGPALSMEMYLRGPRCHRNRHVVDYAEINIDYFEFAPRIIEPRLLREERLLSFAEINLKISANLAMREAERCFNCGLCNQCDNCRLFCPEIAVCREESAQGRHIDYDFCKGCGLCVVECPRNAMVLEEEG
jgi:Pyruvate/2-oxoacid:ferredoxin oxidoreductase delta subunit